ncbi:unnamed protein product [Diamesa hyperborea]
MSQMNEESDSSTRMTRLRLRKSSIDQQMESETRSSTPSRLAKKMEPITESEVVQQSPRRSRRISASDDELVLSKRVKMLSTEVKSQSPVPRRRTRASSAEPSDDEAVIFVSENNPNSRAARMKQRQSVILSPTVELITEDDELNISNELELRNRSISKSPASVYLSPKLSEEIFAVSENNEENILPLSQFVKDKIMEVEPIMSPSQITPRTRLSIVETQKNGTKEAVPENGNSGVASTISPEMFSEDEAEFHETENVNSIIDRITSPKPSTPKSTPSTPATNGTPNRLVKTVDSEEVIDTSQPASSLAIQGRRSYRERSLANKEQSFSEMEGSPIRNKKAPLALNNSPLINFNTPVKTIIHEITIEKEKTPLAKTPKTPLKVVEMTPVKSSSTPMKISSAETPVREKETKSMDISRDTDSDMDITLLSLKKKGMSKTPQPTKVATVSKTLSKSWSQAVEASSTNNTASIDSFSTTVETKTVIKSKTPSKLIDTDTEGEDEEENENEDEDQEPEERNEFVLDEAEEGEEDSMDSSERNYIKENEIVEDGEDLGSEDTDGDDIDEEEEDDSFIASDGPEIDDQYSLDSDEEVIELRKSRTAKRQSRIIDMPDSSDEEVVVEKSPAKTPRKSLAKKSPEVVIEKDDVSSKKRKREDKLDDSVVVNSKRAKLSETIVDATDDSYESSDYEDALEKSVELDVDTTLKTPSKKQKQQTPKKSPKESPMEVEEMQQDDEITEKKKKVKKAKTTVADIDTIINKCNSILSKSEQEKKANKALKKIRKMEEKRLKLSLKQSTDSANTSTENKENTLKKKKYKKNMKQKAVEEDVKKDDMAASLSKFSEKLERKRLRKAEKKLEKKTLLENYVAPEVLEEVAPPVVKADKKKKSVNEVVPVVQEEVEEPVKEKKKKKKKSLVEQNTNIIEEEEVKQPSKKKMKKMAQEEQIAEAPVVKEKSKKRKLQETSFEIDEHVEVPVLKKKLNVLKKIENPTKMLDVPQPQLAPQSKISGLEELAKIPPPAPAGKIKALIPKELDIVSKKRKRNQNKKVYAEPKNALPRPVWTSSGMFMEEPMTPFKFQENSYVALQGTGTSTEFGVMSFEGGKKRQQKKEQDTTAPMNFKTKAMFPLISAIPLSDVQTTKIGAVAVTTTAEKPVENVKTTQTTVEQEVSENASVENTDSLPPLIFPTDQNKIVAQNATALKILQHSYQTEPSKIDKQEVSSTKEAVVASTESSDSTISTTKLNSEEDYSNESEVEVDTSSDVEILQNKKEKVDLEEQFGRNNTNLFQDAVTTEPIFHNGHVAAIFAGLLIVLSALCYLGLVFWRNKLEGKYGMRERLVNEDDYYSTNDVRYFGL